MASGVSVSGKRNYTAAFNSAGSHLISGRPFAMTFEVEHGSSIATFEATPALGGNGNVRVISPAGANMDFTTGNGTTAGAINGITVNGQIFKISFPSTMSSVQISVQETSGTNTATCRARVLFVQPGLDGASSSKSNPEARGAYVQLGDTPTAPEGAVGFSTAMNQIYIAVENTGAGTAAPNAEKITFLVTGHMPLTESDITPVYDNLSTFVFSDTSGVG